jgi:hypothetical protein
MGVPVVVPHGKGGKRREGEGGLVGRNGDVVGANNEGWEGEGEVCKVKVWDPFLLQHIVAFLRHGKGTWRAGKDAAAGRVILLHFPCRNILRPWY